MKKSYLNFVIVIFYWSYSKIYKRLIKWKYDRLRFDLYKIIQIKNALYTADISISNILICIK